MAEEMLTLQPKRSDKSQHSTMALLGHDRRLDRPDSINLLEIVELCAYIIISVR